MHRESSLFIFYIWILWNECSNIAEWYSKNFWTETCPITAQHYSVWHFSGVGILEELYRITICQVITKGT
jgi:hypothetical protein